MRLAVSASRALGSAVVRNRSRRRIREAFRAAIAEMDRSSGLDLVVVAQPALLDATFAAVKTAAAQSLRAVVPDTVSAV